MAGAGACLEELLRLFERRDGPGLHDRVAPQKWCVTQADLRHFRALVARAVRGGLVAPDKDSLFDPADEKGPPISAVTRQLIKPIALRKGCPSWALMLHPDGLECDLFVTHCWLEGTFEFTDKVLHAWPRAARHAYCCMLSNPQNLDIGSLISAPESSPFALALSSASYTLVVPNDACSIYTRIWCIYEAYLSYSWDKTIFTATKQDKRPVLVALRAVVAFALAGGVCFACSASGVVRGDTRIYLVLLFWLLVCAIVTLYGKAFSGVRIVHRVGVCLCGIFFALVLHHLLSPSSGKVSALYSVVRPLVSAVYLAFGFITFALAEVDCCLECAAEIEAVQLRRGYTGRLRDAQSANTADRQRILTEIQHRRQEAEVEHAIRVLIAAGMSTPNLRRANTLGVDVSGAGRYRLALVYSICLVFILHPACYLAFEQASVGHRRWVAALEACEGIVWLVLFKISSPDMRGFAASAGTLLGALPCFTIWVGCLAWADASHRLNERAIDRHATDYSHLLGAAVCGPAMLVFSVLGAGRVAAIPWCGPAIAQVLLGRGPRNKAGHGERTAASSTHSSSEGSGSDWEDDSSDSSDEDPP